MGPRPKGKRALAKWNARKRNAVKALKNIKRRKGEGKAAFAKRTARATTYARNSDT